MRTLVCDGDPSVVALVRDALKGQGHDIAEAFDAEAASREVRAFWPEIVVLDLTTIGLDVLREMRAERFPLEIFVIVLTADPSDGAILESYEAGADGVLTKPFNPLELVPLRPRD